MSEGSGGRGEAGEIAGNVKRLDAELCVVFIGSVAPAANFDVHFAVMGIAVVIPGDHAENGGRLEMSSVADG